MVEVEQAGVKASDTITRLVYRSVLEEYRKREEELRNPSILYVTDLVSCSHKRALRLSYPEITFKFEPQLVLGNLVHKGLEDILEENEYKVEVEVEAEYEVMGSRILLKGRVDAVSKDAVVEIKSARSDQGLPHEHHVMQLQIYLNMLGLDKGILIYITPDRIAEYLVEREPLNIKDLVEETILDLKHPRWSWECRYCPFSRICPYKML